MVCHFNTPARITFHLRADQFITKCMLDELSQICTKRDIIAKVSAKNYDATGVMENVLHSEPSLIPINKSILNNTDRRKIPIDADHLS